MANRAERRFGLTNDRDRPAAIELASRAQRLFEAARLHLDIVRDLKRVNAHLSAAAYPVLEGRGELLTSRLRQDTE
jgi:Na+/phosphate symporter